MREFEGKYASCKVFNDEVEETAVDQIKLILDCPAFEGSKIRIMPDVHAGSGAVIGFTSTLTDKIVSNVVGVDLGCGVLAYKLKMEKGGFNGEFYAKLDKTIRTRIPSGHSVNTFIPNIDPVLRDRIAEVVARTNQSLDYVLKSICSLGSGNHFCSIEGDYLCVHTGSRNFGLKIATFHQNKAIAKMGKNNGLEWLEGSDAEEYYADMKVAQEFATLNRETILKRILEALDCDFGDQIESVHNYIDFEAGIIRKGAISAKVGEPIILPLNMRDGSIIGTGLGNEDWNFSSPHGAGRLMGRKQAMRTLNLEDFQKTMEGVWSSCIKPETLDEAPQAYKDTETILSYVRPTMDIVERIKTRYNFKAG